MAQAVRKKTTSSRRYRSAPQAPVFRPLPDGVNVNASVKADMDEIARLGPARAAAFMNGIASVINATNQIRERP